MIQPRPVKPDAHHDRRADRPQRLVEIRRFLFRDPVQHRRVEPRAVRIRQAVEIANHRRRGQPGSDRQPRTAIRGDDRGLPKRPDRQHIAQNPLRVRRLRPAQKQDRPICANKGLNRITWVYVGCHCSRFRSEVDGYHRIVTK